jgi:hypothetical protein
LPCLPRTKADELLISWRKASIRPTPCPSQDPADSTAARERPIARFGMFPWQRPRQSAPASVRVQDNGDSD